MPRHESSDTFRDDMSLIPLNVNPVLSITGRFGNPVPVCDGVWVNEGDWDGVCVRVGDCEGV